MMSCPSIYKVSYKVKIMISKAVTLAGTVLIAAMAAAPAHATPVTVTHDYGTNLDKPKSGGIMNTQYVMITSPVAADGGRFYDAINFDLADFETIHSLTLTLSINRVQDRYEDWRVYGSTTGGTDVRDGSQLGTASLRGSAWSFVLTSGKVFDQAVAARSLNFWFGEANAPASHDFWLYSAILTVDGAAPAPGPAPAPIPLPAAGLLLIGSLGGFVLLRRRGSG